MKYIIMRRCQKMKLEILTVKLSEDPEDPPGW